MSEQEKLVIQNNLLRSMAQSTMRMLERKMKLGEQVVIADANGQPIKVTAEEALKIFRSRQ
jgi:hypothetical protein